MTRLNGVHGLRGLAVLTVISFHGLGSYYVPGGWAGVDVFFVISGYLITRMLMEGGLDDLRGFFARRAARLFPALLLLCAVVAAWPRLNGGNPFSVMPALLYVSNLTFTGQVHMQLAPTLAHTWSLSQEEQFYVVWPLLLIVLVRLPRWIALTIVTGLAAWALHATFMTSGYDDPLRHSAPLLAGCGLALAGSKAKLRFAGLAGLVLFLLCVIVLARNAPYMKLEPIVVLAGLLLVAGAEHVPAFSVQPLQWLGTYSYGLYLWHGPLLLNIPVQRPIAVGLLIVIVIGSYHLIELPIRRYVKQRTRERSTRWQMHSMKTSMARS